MASSAFHFSGMQRKEDQDSVEWALRIELGRECSLRLLPPGSAGGTILPPVAPPSTPPSSMSNRAASAAPPLSPNRSAHLERPTSQDAVPSRAVPQRQENHRTSTQEEHETSLPSDPSVPIPLHRQVPALARNPVVRENSSSTDTEVENTSLPEAKENVTTRLEFVAKKAKHDPVVQEVVRMFRADIKDVHLK